MEDREPFLPGVVEGERTTLTGHIYGVESRN